MQHVLHRFKTCSFYFCLVLFLVNFYTPSVYCSRGSRDIEGSIGMCNWNVHGLICLSMHYSESNCSMITLYFNYYAKIWLKW